jgi:hypothetical protein
LRAIDRVHGKNMIQRGVRDSRTESRTESRKWEQVTTLCKVIGALFGDAREWIPWCDIGAHVDQRVYNGYLEVWNVHCDGIVEF